jgi:zinc transporter ZupT
MVMGNFYAAGDDAKLKNFLVFVVCVCAHIWVEFFLLSRSLMKANLLGLVWIHIVANPLGYGLAKMLQNVCKDTFSLYTPYIDSFAAGTLVYIAVTEIVPEVFESDHGKRGRQTIKFSVFCAAGAFVIWLTQQHSHH